MGTMIQQSGVEMGENPELLNFTHPEIIIEIHRKYIAAGADVITTNTFGANSFKLAGTGYTPCQVIAEGVKLASDAGASLVAADIGPIGKLLEPLGDLTFDEAYEAFKEQAVAAEKAGADILLVETMTDLGQMRAALLACKENTALPVIGTMSFEEGGRTFTGCSIEVMALTISPLADAVGINCSLGPNEMLPMVERLVKVTNKPILIQPNAGLPCFENGCTHYHVTPEEFKESMKKIAALGVEMLGGCCGTTPDFIAAIKDLERGKRADSDRKLSLCSATKVVDIDGVRVIGERINPTGKKLFKEALRNNDMAYILQQAVSQVEAGSDILDVNVGLPEIDEPAMMKAVVSNLQAVTDLPLQIDSSDPVAIEAALRIYNGRAIVNSVNGETKVMENILPLVKKYGACVVGLTLDEKGIPQSAEERLEIAKRIVAKAESFGIPREDVFIDCLTLTVSAQQKDAAETLKAVSMVKSQLGLKTVLGVSNISFGLPRRDIVNETFLAEALVAGLDLPIINPNAEGMMSRIDAHRVLWAQDAGCVKYVEKYSDSTLSKVVAVDKTPDLEACILKGLKDKASTATETLLETMKELQIVDEVIIPTLNKVGEDYDKGKIFLPQLLLAAETVQEAFSIIKSRLPADTSISKGTIIMATVKGDIHDIGKNIVKIILENYGYTVIDMGKDVPAEAILQKAEMEDVRLVGLSALMTTTVKSMADTINLLKCNKSDVKVMVGGAVLTPEYASAIGADFYGKDAKAAVEIANKVFD
ncbi:MAG: homocysteine methyltransferase [Ruminococcaceae bacterium]|nr:homocysteine methyltransferase [Oscillospiraceae bacterium]